MTDSKRRKNLVSFRLSDEEYGELRRAISSRDGQSLSDFLRRAVLGSARANLGRGNPDSGDSVHVEVRVSDLPASIRQLDELREEIGEVFARHLRGESRLVRVQPKVEA
jgi:hypothetical protein